MYFKWVNYSKVSYFLWKQARHDNNDLMQKYIDQ